MQVKTYRFDFQRGFLKRISNKTPTLYPGSTDQCHMLAIMLNGTVNEAHFSLNIKK